MELQETTPVEPQGFAENPRNASADDCGEPQPSASMPKSPVAQATSEKENSTRRFPNFRVGVTAWSPRMRRCICFRDHPYLRDLVPEDQSTHCYARREMKIPMRLLMIRDEKRRNTVLRGDWWNWIVMSGYSDPQSQLMERGVSSFRPSPWKIKLNFYVASLRQAARDGVPWRARIAASPPDDDEIDDSVVVCKGHPEVEYSASGKSALRRVQFWDPEFPEEVDKPRWMLQVAIYHPDKNWLEKVDYPGLIKAETAGVAMFSRATTELKFPQRDQVENYGFDFGTMQFWDMSSCKGRALGRGDSAILERGIWDIIHADDNHDTS